MTQDAQEKLIIELIKKYAPKCNDKNSLRVMTLAVNDTVTLQGSEIRRLRDERKGLEDRVRELEKDAEACDKRHAEFVFPERDGFKARIKALEAENENLKRMLEVKNGKV